MTPGQAPSPDRDLVKREEESTRLTAESRMPIAKPNKPMDYQSVCDRFKLCPRYGFVTNVGERERVILPAPLDQWMKLADECPALTATGQIRKIVDAMPLMDLAVIRDDRLKMETLYRVLSFISHGYVRGRLHDKSMTRIPECLAKLWVELAESLGTQPIITYCSSVLYNFRLLDATQPLSLENIWTIHTSSGSMDESWFYVVSLIIEAQSGELIRLFLDLQAAATAQDHNALLTGLQRLVELISQLQATLVRMYEENIPAVFYQRVRRYLAGWLNDEQMANTGSDGSGGLIYGLEPKPRSLAGGSAAQSPIIQCLDIVLGIRHARRPDHEDTGVGSAGNYLMEMRQYMSANHRDFLVWMEEHVNLHGALIQMDETNPLVMNCKEAFNECVRRLRCFRDKHLAMVATYVTAQAARCETHTAIKGTGGSNPIPFLKEVRSHMANVVIPGDLSLKKLTLKDDGGLKGVDQANNEH